MAILIAHHLQEMWDDKSVKYNTNCRELTHRLISYLETSDSEYEKIIITICPNSTPDEPVSKGEDLFSPIEGERSHEALFALCELVGIPIDMHYYGFGWKHGRVSTPSLSEVMKHHLITEKLTESELLEITENEHLFGYELLDQLSESTCAKLSPYELATIELHNPQCCNFEAELFNVDWTSSTRRDSTDNDVVVIPDWLHDLRHEEIHLCGAFEGQCIEDIEAALKAADVRYNRLEHLIIGTTDNLNVHQQKKSPYN